jgi:hypothetical protein
VTRETEDARRGWREGPDPAAQPRDWLALSDDELLYRIESLAPGHGRDEALLRIVASPRHFFIRQEAAKRVDDRDRLKAFCHDRHVGQILARSLDRAEDVTYLERLSADSRHLEVRKAAEAQLRRLRQRLAESEARERR